MRFAQRHSQGAFLPITAVIIALALPSCRVSAAPGKVKGDGVDQAAFNRALEKYDAGMATLIHSPNAEERAAAIRGAASVASPGYELLRDDLLQDQSPTVRIALLEAIGLMGDTSPAAVRYLENALASEDRQIVSEAIRVEYHDLRVPLAFRNLWVAKKANFLWGNYLSTNGWVNWELIRGVGEVKPWLDPAWAELAYSTRMNLMFRAGTRESVQLGIATAMAQDPPKWWGLFAGEPVDLPFMREMLKDSHPEIRKYAAQTLGAAKDPAYLSALHTEVQEYHKGIANIPASALEDLSVGTALPLLNESELNGLLQDDPAKWFQSVYFELDKRGKPISYSDLRGRRQPSPLFDISRVPQELLRSCQIRAMIREKVYSDLPDFITLALMSSNTAYAMSNLEGIIGSRQLFRGDIAVTGWDFRRNLPPEIAKISHDKLADWLGRSPQQGGPPATNPNGADSARIVVAMLASREDRQAAWKVLKDSKDPLRETGALQTVLWGCDQRGDSLRQMFAAQQKEAWYSKRLGYSLTLPLGGISPESPIPDACQGRSYAAWLSFDLPAGTPAISSLRDDLVQGIHEAMIRTPMDFAQAFLVTRGVPVDPKEPTVSIRWLVAPASAIRSAASTVLSPTLQSNGLSTPAPNLPDNPEDWLANARSTLAAPHPPREVALPALTAEETTWVEGLLREERKKYFSDMVENLIHPKPSGVIACGGRGYSPPSPSISMPSDVFVREAGIGFQSEIRDCLRSREPVVRHAAALALWKMLGDPQSLAVFTKDASDANIGVRASALWTLQSLRRRESAPLFPRLLREKDAPLRQVGILGARAFNLQEAMPEILSLVADQDTTTGRLAVETLGQCRFSEARPLLLRLVLDESPLTSTAIVALTNFRSEKDLDALFAEISKSGVSEASQVRILGIVSEITGRMGPQPLGTPFGLGREQKLEAGTLEDWKAWWANHRKMSAGDRAMSVLSDQIHFLLAETDEKKLGPAQGRLKRRLPGLFCLNSWGTLNPKCHESVEAWWARHEGDSPWEVLTSQESDPWLDLDLLWDADPQRTKHMLFDLFYRFATGRFYHPWPHASSQESFHDRLVRYAHVDFGDPGPARCGTKEKILSDWMAWAQKEGWSG